MSNTKDICLFEGREHVFLYNLIPYKRRWYCDIIETEDSLAESNVKTVLFDKVTFPGDKEEKRKNYLIQCETEKAEGFYQKIAKEFKAKIKKIQQLEAAGKV